MTKKNSDVAKVMRDLGFLTEVGEDDPNAQFRARAYYRAADTIASLPEDVAVMYSRNGIKGLLEIPSIGKAIAAKIEEYIKTGKVHTLEKMKAEIPINIDELYGLEGVGPKTIRALYDKLQVKNLADLEKAAREGRLRTVPGFTERKEQDVLKKIEFFRTGRGRHIIGEVYPLIKQIEKSLLQVAGVKNAVAAGSVRRMKETIGDIDYLVAASDPEPVMDFFTKMPEVQEVFGRGPAKAFVRLTSGIDADLLVVPEESWGSALQYFTGSKEHSVELRKIALSKGLRLNEWGVFKGEKRVAGAAEEEVYQALGLQWMPPEMRENAGEIELARQNRIPKLVEYGSLKGDLQVHSENSDGTATIEEMARGAKAFGLDYIAITDHTKSLALAGGLDGQELLEQAQKIAELNDRLEGGFRVLASAEVNIMKDGSLDIADNVLDKLDIVGAAIHSHFNLPVEAQTERLTRAAKNPNVDILFHPTGRLINKRLGYPVDIEQVIEVAKDTGTVLEIDAHYDRLDLKDEYARMAVKKGVKLVVDSDAHHPIHYAFLMFGVAQARRGWATPADVLNTLPADRLLKVLK
ncbi:DNA polymerase/3'-5' exonuclease PolX [Candidatus Nitrososphaera gargensis]|uniref:DNA polymerase/3'-5' exonuclease PolX n=1 Tax=Candidatus Nitrososphaera gargensis TaxID=497727 RepID=UPI001650747F|nr:DNA polymerase/3'-5' exonuclease PolX [Candidatus Nitrososphaera gargensis]